MLSTAILCRNREFIFKNLQKQIGKTTTATISDAVTRKGKTELYQNILNNIQRTRSNRHNNNRVISTIQKTFETPTIASKDESRKFNAVFPDLVRDLTDAGQHSDIPEVNERFAKLLRYTVPNMIEICGIFSLISYKLLEKPENLTPENIRRAIILGWCNKMIEAAFTIADDFMDNQELRYGGACWHNLEDVGKFVVNDSVLLMEGCYAIIKKYFSNHQCYIPTMELIHDIVLKSAMGQALDTSSLRNGRPNFELFTMNRYHSIVKYKAGYFTFTLPMALSMYLANLYDPEMHRQAKTILMDIALFYQIQDDFIDCFGDPEITDNCTDISEGKCTWLSVVALQRANSHQRTIMEEYYGKDDQGAVKIIKNLYEELNLPKMYAIHEVENYNIIRTRIQQLSKRLPHELFFKIIEAIYKRQY